MPQRLIQIKIFDKDGKQLPNLFNCTDGNPKSYIYIDGKQYHYAYDKGCYIEDESDDDIPF